MNPLTLVKRIQNINAKEASLGISDKASWHVTYKDSAYVFVGGIPFDLTEGDVLAVFSQYGEVVDLNLVRDKGSGKSKGFAFVAYEDQRSTILAVNNLNNAPLSGRTIRVDHVSNYKKKQEEADEETEEKEGGARGLPRKYMRHDDMTSKEYGARRYERKQKRSASESYHAAKRESRKREKRAHLHHDGRDEEDRSYRSRTHVSHY